MSNRLIPEVSVVIPVFRSARTVEQLCSRIAAVLKAREGGFEVILVEDGSGDETWEAVVRAVRGDPSVRGLRLARNFGQHNALLCGIQAARGDLLVTMDDDLQNPPEEIPLLLAKLAEDFDVVYGTPGKRTHGLLRNMAARITKLTMQAAMGAEMATKTSAFRAFRSDVKNGFKDYRSPTVDIDVLLTWGTTRFAAVEVRQDKRVAGRSGYSVDMLVRHAFNKMTGFSTFPLRIASFAGFIFGLLGVCVLIYVLVNYLVRGGTVPGFTFLAAIIAVFSGIQLFALGMIGEYLARVHFRSMDRPPFVVAETIESQGEEAGSDSGSGK